MGNFNSWGPALAGFAQGFASSMDNAQRNRKFKMRLDAELAVRGYEPMNGDEVKEFAFSQRAKGFKAGEGAATLPEGSKAKGGKITDKSGTMIGEYAKGFEPTKVKKLQEDDGSVVSLGGTYYKYNPDLAMKMRGYEAKSSAARMKEIKEKLNEEFEDGTWTPTYDNFGANTFKYTPAQNENLEEQNDEAALINEKKMQIRNAIQNALAQGADKNEIIAGIKEEGLDPVDFADIFSRNFKAPKRQPNVNNMFGLPQQPAPMEGKPERKTLKAA